MLGMEAGVMNGDGEYAEGTLLHLAKKRAKRYWEQISSARQVPVQAKEAEDGDEAEAES